MAKNNPKAVARVLLERHGQTYAQELGIQLSTNSPSSLYRLLVYSLLASARIRASVAVAATKALIDQGWTMPEDMVRATWAERTYVLNHAGYARYDEKTSRMLESTSVLLLEKYHGNVAELRSAAGRDVNKERALLKEFKGIGDVGASIFLREVQVVWEEVFPFADRRALEEAELFGLPDTPEQLVDLVGKKDFPRLVAALSRSRLAKDEEEVLEAAESGEKDGR